MRLCIAPTRLLNLFRFSSYPSSVGGKSVTVQIVDKCVGCAEFDLNFSPAAFDVFAKHTNVGILRGVSWFVVGGGE